MTYPNFIRDRAGLDRWRESARAGDGHELVANRNTIYRFVQTIDFLESRLAVPPVSAGVVDRISDEDIRRLLDRKDVASGRATLTHILATLDTTVPET